MNEIERGSIIGIPQDHLDAEAIKDSILTGILDNGYDAVIIEYEDNVGKVWRIEVK